VERLCIGAERKNTHQTPETMIEVSASSVKRERADWKA
jgi:hypothetical protein